MARGTLCWYLLWSTVAAPHASTVYGFVRYHSGEDKQKVLDGDGLAQKTNAAFV